MWDLEKESWVISFPSYAACLPVPGFMACNPLTLQPLPKPYQHVNVGVSNRAVYMSHLK